MDKRPIGIFDSGVGGLTVFKEIKKALPYENTIYFADTAHFPYGDKPKSLILNYSLPIINFLKKNNVKAVIIACNTASAYCYLELKNTFTNLPIIEIINSGATNAVNLTKNNKIGLLATKATIKSLKYDEEIKNLNKNAKVFSVACPKFAPLVENNLVDSPLADLTAKEYILPLLKNNIDTLILGCTHYPILINSINKIIPTNINIVNPAVEVVNRLKSFLIKNNLTSPKTNNPLNKFYTNNYTERFEHISHTLMKQKYLIQKINL